MFSIADFLDRAKSRASIDSDYRLAIVIGISHGTMSGYRSGKSMPDERVIAQLCALSGEDSAIVAAQIQAERSRTDEGKAMWSRIAARLASGAGTAILSVLFTISLIAASVSDARATGLTVLKTQAVNLIYIVSSTFLTVGVFLHERRHRWPQGFPGLLRLCASAAW
jgi:transcriptional regulator with XRE-family HTH domain